jgi:NHL repeat
MTVTFTGPSKLLLAAALCLAPAAALAEGIAFVHDSSIYIDAKEKPLLAPEGVACADSGALVVADTGNHRLLLYTYKDGRLGGGTEVKLAQLTSPVRLQITSKGDLLALDGKTRKIVKVAADGTFGGLLEPKGLEGPGEPVIGAFKLDASDNAWVLDIAGRRVLVLDAEGKVTRQVKLPAASGTVTDIALDLAGTLYAVDGVGGAVWVAEKGAAEMKLLVKDLKDRMSFPGYLVAAKGRLFLVDLNGSGIVLLGVDGSYQGRQLSIGWSEGLVNYPSQLCLTEAGTAFVADRFNNRVQVFATSR